MNIRVITPTRTVCSTEAEEILIPSLTGKIGILEGHISLVTALDIGLLKIRMGTKWTPILLLGGVAQIDQDLITVLAPEVQELQGINLSEANKDLEKATLQLEEAEASEDKIAAALEVKRLTALIEGINFIS
jgi:F-type H+-transporting ATPase subunit epsilon